MRAGKYFLAGSAILFVAAVVQAENDVPVAPPAAPIEAISINPADVVAGRQSTFLLSGALFGSMKGAIDRGDDVKGQAFAARTIARWAKTIPAMFPVGSGGGASEALPNIWTDRDGFEAKAVSYSAEADKLAGMAAAGDKAGFASQWGVVRETCNACHTAYRHEDEKKP